MAPVIFPLMEIEIEMEMEILLSQKWKVKMEFNLKWNQKQEWILSDKNGIRMGNKNY